jgi:hypothetical protein
MTAALSFAVLALPRAVDFGSPLAAPSIAARVEWAGAAGRGMDAEAFLAGHGWPVQEARRGREAQGIDSTASSLNRCRRGGVLSLVTFFAQAKKVTRALARNSALLPARAKRFGNSRPSSPTSDVRRTIPPSRAGHFSSLARRKVTKRRGTPRLHRLAEKTASRSPALLAAKGDAQTRLPWRASARPASMPVATLASSDARCSQGDPTATARSKEKARGASAARLHRAPLSGLA